MSVESKYAGTGLSTEEVASLEACDAAHAAWWERNKVVGWCSGQDPFALRIAFNAGWYHAASAGEAGTAGTTEIGPVHERPTAEGGDAQNPADTSGATP